MQLLENVFGFVKKMTGKIVPSEQNRNIETQSFKKSEVYQVTEGQTFKPNTKQSNLFSKTVPMNSKQRNLIGKTEKFNNRVRGSSPRISSQRSQKKHILAPKWVVLNQKPVNDSIKADPSQSSQNNDSNTVNFQGYHDRMREGKKQKKINKQLQKGYTCVVGFDEEFIRFSDLNGDDISSIAQKSETADEVDHDLDDFVCHQGPKNFPSAEAESQRSPCKKRQPVVNRGRRQFCPQFIEHLRNRIRDQNYIRQQEQLLRRKAQLKNPLRNNRNPNRRIRIHQRNQEEKMLNRKLKKIEYARYGADFSDSEDSDCSESSSEESFRLKISYGSEQFEPILVGLSSSNEEGLCDKSQYSETTKMKTNVRTNSEVKSNHKNTDEMENSNRQNVPQPEQDREVTELYSRASKRVKSENIRAQPQKCHRMQKE